MDQRKKHKKIYLIAGVVLAAALIAGYFSCLMQSGCQQ